MVVAGDLFCGPSLALPPLFRRLVQHLASSPLGAQADLRDGGKRLPMADEERDYVGRTGAQRACGAFLLTTDEPRAHNCARILRHSGPHQSGATGLRWWTEPPPSGEWTRTVRAMSPGDKGLARQAVYDALLGGSF